MGWTRRQMLAGLSFVTAMPLGKRPALARARPAGLAHLFRLPPSTGAMQQTAEGPFYFEKRSDRQNITDGRPGLPLELILSVIDEKSRLGLAGARVDIWHADAAGCYSGFQGQGDDRTISTVGQTFLRGTQVADDTGNVRFFTIYPGWYAGRTAHVHFKIIVGGKTASVGQIYFPDDFNRFVFTTVPPYSQRQPPRDTRNRDDRVLALAGGGRDAFALVDFASNRLVVSLTIAVGP